MVCRSSMGAPDVSRAGDWGEIEAGKERDIRGRDPPHANWRPCRAVARNRKREHDAACKVRGHLDETLGRGEGIILPSQIAGSCPASAYL